MAKLDTRDFSFKPVNFATAKRLTKQQIDQFNELGYCFPFKLFDERAAANIRSYIDHLFALLADRGELR